MSRKGCAVLRFRRICGFLITRFERISLTALSTKSVVRHVGAAHSSQRVTAGMKIFGQIADMPPGGRRTPDIADVTEVEPIRQFRQAAETGAQTTGPKLPLGAIGIANSEDAKVGGWSRPRRSHPPRARRARSAWSVPPVEDERRLGHDPSLRLSAVLDRLQYIPQIGATACPLIGARVIEYNAQYQLHRCLTQRRSGAIGEACSHWMDCSLSGSATRYRLSQA
jgi:hypothetical protein